jgi:hypothetical protein
MAKLWTVGLQDFIKGLIVAVLTAILTTFAQLLPGGEIDLKKIGVAGLVAGCAYLIKQLGTDENGAVLGKYKL